MKKILSKRIGLSILLVFGTTVLSSLYQNCSKVTLNDLDAEAKAAEAERIALGKDDELVTAGTSPVPGLSMFFVVDNSGTMVQNQLNLAQSFGAMFDSSAESLAKFETTTYILNTAQRSPSFLTEMSSLNAISDRQKSFSQDWMINLTDFQNSVRTPTTNGGQIPGDNLGYYLKKTDTKGSPLGTLSFVFSPAYVQGASVVNSSQVALSPSIHKAALASSQYMEDEFKRRLDVLSATRFPYSQGVAEFANIVDSESGLCAMARALRNQTPGDPAAAIRSDNLTSMVVVSDEDDNDPQGNNCIQSVVQTLDSTPYVNGQCRLPVSTIQSRFSTPSPDMCYYSVNTGYKVTWTYPNPRIGTYLEYKAQISAAYWKKKTFWVKYEVKTKKYRVRKTNLTFYGLEGNPIVSDGIVTNQDSWEPIANAFSKVNLAGYTAPGASCLALARTFEQPIIRPQVQKGLRVDTTRPVTCDPIWVDVGTTACNTSDVNNCTAYNDTTIKSGNLGLNTAAAAQAVADSDSNYNPGSALIDRGQEGDSVTDAASCTAAYQAAGFCYQVAAVNDWKGVTLNDQDLFTTQGCYAYANNPANLSDSVVNNNPANVRNCVKVNYGNKQSTVSMSFATSSDGGVTQTVDGSRESCNVAAMRSKALTLAQAVDGVIKSTDTCSITGITNIGSTPSAYLSGYPNCTAQTAAYCSASQPGNRCSGVQSASSPTFSAWTNFIVDHPESVTCDTKCSDSTQNVCGGQNPTLTIAQHLQTIQGGGDKTVYCQIVNPGYLAVSSDPGVVNFTGLLAQNKTTACNGLPGPKRVFVATGKEYTQPAQVITDYVAGTVINGSGQAVPKMGLVSYIKQRSQELANGQVLFTALVRKSTDPVGNNGSVGVAYEQLVQQTGGQLESVLSTDYSVALRTLSSVIKNNLEKTFLLKKMRPNQIITNVYLIKKGSSNPVLLPKANWVQNGATLKIENLDFVEGDQFKVEFQNYLQ